MDRVVKQHDALRRRPRSPTPPWTGQADGHWKALTSLANKAFAAEQWQEADSLYRQALEEAETVFRAWLDATPDHITHPPAMLVVSTANIAECGLRRGEGKQAGDGLVALCHRLCDVILSKKARQDVREQCYLHLRAVVMELADKLPRAGWSQEQTTHELALAKAAALHFLAQQTCTQ